MTRTARLAQLTLAVALIGLLVGAPSQPGASVGAQSGVTISSAGVIASGPGEAVNTRLQRDTRAERANAPFVRMD